MKTNPDLTDNEIKALCKLHGWRIDMEPKRQGIDEYYYIWNSSNWCVGCGKTMQSALEHSIDYTNQNPDKL